MESVIAASSAALVTGYLVELAKLAVPDIEPWLVVLVSLSAGILSAFLIATASGAPLDAAGIATRILEGVGAAAAAAGAGAAPAAAAGAGAAAPATAAVSILAMTWSAATVAPSPCTISTITPAEGAGHSSTTLSVSISMRISSTATASPTFFFHCSRVASATDSESCGTLTSTIAIFLNPVVR